MDENNNYNGYGNNQMGNNNFNNGQGDFNMPGGNNNGYNNQQANYGPQNYNYTNQPYGQMNGYSAQGQGNNNGFNNNGFNNQGYNYGYNQPQYSNNGGYVMAPRKKTSKALPFIIIGSVIAFFIIIGVISACIVMANNTKEEVTLSSERVSTVYKALGNEKQVISYSKSHEDGAVKVRMKYANLSRIEVQEYFDYLENNEGFYLLESSSVNPSADLKIGKESDIDGKVVFVDATFSGTEIIIDYTLIEGSIY